MAGPKGDQAAGSHGEYTMIAGAVVAAVGAYVAWQFLSGPIVQFVFGSKWLQLTLRDWTIGLSPLGKENLLFLEGHFTGVYDPWSTSIWTLFNISSAVGEAMKYPIAILIGMLSLLVMMRPGKERFTRGFGLAGKNSLASYQANFHRTFVTGANFNPDTAGPEQASSRTPMTWIDHNKVRLSAAEGGLDDDGAKLAFERQLGEDWGEIPKMSLHVRCLIAIFGAHANRKKDKSAPANKNVVGLILREEIAVAYDKIKDPKKLEETLEALIAPVLADKKTMDPVREMAKKHAYVTTALIRLLEWSRETEGVLASSEFRWLKGIDRTLWYCLNDTGRRVFHVESAGVASHYFFERVADRPLIEIRVDKAVEGLATYLQDQGIEDFDEWRDFAKRHDIR